MEAGKENLHTILYTTRLSKDYLNKSIVDIFVYRDILKVNMNLDSIYIDELSGVYNRRYLKERQSGEIKKFIAHKVPFSVVIIDIDHFKEINDTYGHVKGDEIIAEFARFLKRALRTQDTVIRYGGDEFVCIMQHARRQNSRLVYERVLKRGKEREFAGLHITLSAGISSYPDDGQDFNELLKIADGALYDAKRGGRDRLGTARKKRVELPIKVFINRIEEKDRFKGLIVNIENGMKTAVVKGNIGIGKTRLVKEVLNNTGGREVIWSDCLAFAEDIPYYAIREMIKYKVQRLGKGILEDIPLVYRLELGKLVPELMEGIKEKVNGIDLVMDKYRLYESVRKVMEIKQKESVIVVDNTQWLDRESVEVIKYLIRSLRDDTIIFIFIYRSEEVNELLEDFLSYISREIVLQEFKLRSFEYKEIKESVKSIIGEEPVRGLMEYIQRESGGNPFYIEELMRVLVNERYLIIEDDVWRFREPEEEIVPKSIEDIAMRKYRSLNKEAQEILEIAAAIGWFDVETIKEITGYNEGHIIGLTNDVNRLGMTKEVRGRIEFSEEISRNAIYRRNVEGIKRVELHRRVAERIEEYNRGKEHKVVEELAVHYYLGQEKEKGVNYCIEAGDRAKEKYANSNALKYYTWALQLLKDEQEEDKLKTKIDCLLKRVKILSLIGDNEGALRDLEGGLKASRMIRDNKREADLTLAKASVYHGISRYKEAIQQAVKCKEIYQDIGDKENLAKSIYTIAAAYSRFAEFEKAMGFFREALRIYEEIGNKKGEAQVFNNIGNIHMISGKQSSALKFYEDSLKISQEKGYKDLAAGTSINIGSIYGNLGNYSSALKHYEDSLKVFKEIGNRFGEGTSYNNIGNIYGSLGKYRKALKFYEDTLKIEREIGNRNGEALTICCIGSTYSFLGEYHRALKLHEESLEIAREIGGRRCEAYSLSGLGNLYYALGDYDKAAKFYEEAQKVVNQTNISILRFENSLSLGRLYLTLNQRAKAKGFIDKAHDIAKDSDSDALRLNVLLLLSQFYLEEENLEKFEKTIRNVENLWEKIGTKSFEGNINLLLGRGYITTKDFAKADKYLHKALEIYEDLEDKSSIGEVYYYLGMAELVRDNKSGYKEYLNKSLEIFDSIDAEGWKEKVERALNEVNSA